MKSKKVQGIFGETFILALLSSAVFRLQSNFYQSSLENDVDFRDITKVSPNILAKNSARLLSSCH